MYGDGFILTIFSFINLAEIELFMIGSGLFKFNLAGKIVLFGCDLFTCYQHHHEDEFLFSSDLFLINLMLKADIVPFLCGNK